MIVVVEMINVDVEISDKNEHEKPCETQVKSNNGL